MRLTAILIVTLIKCKVLSDDFPQKSETSILFQENSNHSKVLVVMKKIEQVCFLAVEVTFIQLLLHECTSFTIRPQIPGSKKHAFMQFQSCIRTLLGHTVQIRENRGQRTVYLEC